MMLIFIVYRTGNRTVLPDNHYNEVNLSSQAKEKYFIWHYFDIARSCCLGLRILKFRIVPHILPGLFPDSPLESHPSKSGGRLFVQQLFADIFSMWATALVNGCSWIEFLFKLCFPQHFLLESWIAVYLCAAANCCAHSMHLNTITFRSRKNEICLIFIEILYTALNYKLYFTLYKSFTIVSSDKDVSKRCAHLAIRPFLSILEGNIHITIKANKSA